MICVDEAKSLQVAVESGVARVLQGSSTPENVKSIWLSILQFLHRYGTNFQKYAATECTLSLLQVFAVKAHAQVADGYTKVFRFRCKDRQ
jgi:hypothetical protein